MRLLVAILVLLISVSGFAQNRKKTTKRPIVKTAAKPTPRPAPKPVPAEEKFSDEDLSPKSAPVTGLESGETKYPLHSTLHNTPEGRAQLLGTIGMSFGSSSVETLNTPGGTSTDEYETKGIFSLIDLSYGVLSQLDVGLTFGYETSTQKNVSYKDTSGNIGVPLEPDAKTKGLYDPTVFASYRPIETDFVVDLGAALRLGFMGAERSTPEDTNLDPFQRGDKVSDSNFAKGSYGVELGARAGYHLSDRINLVAEVKGEYSFAGSQNYKSVLFGDVTMEQDADTEFSARADVEYFLTPRFIITPFGELAMNPKQKLNYRVGLQNTNSETAAFKTYSVGVMGSYLIQSDLALKAGYSYTSSESAKSQSSINGAPYTVDSNAKDRQKHSIIASVAYEF